jgi:hypothetical protein
VSDESIGSLWVGEKIESELRTYMRGVAHGLRMAQKVVEGASVNNWRPIETAPKDGSDIILCWQDGIAAPRFAVGHNLGAGRRWQTTHEWLHNKESWPTHWTPLPAPPESK